MVEPYVNATHFGAGGSPTYLVGTETEEQPLRLQVSESNDPSDDDWVELPVPGTAGLAASDRYQRWLAWTADLAESDQPSLAAELLSPVVARDKSIRCVRVVRKPTLLLNELQENAPPPYFARVVHLEDGTASLIADQELRLSAVAISGLDPVSEDQPADDQKSGDQATSDNAGDQPSDAGSSEDNQ